MSSGWKFEVIQKTLQEADNESEENQTVNG